MGEMESERSGVEREAGLGFREAMGGGGEARREEAEAGGQQWRRGSNGFYESESL